MPQAVTRIAILDDVTANQIAAGEVIERPAAVVKELVENSIDSGASTILVEIEEGGKHLIRVTDDGFGMSQEDTILSLQRHATSKIQSANDLFRITTMGFRGEALPSIASVSQFTLVSKSSDAPDAPGTEVVCHGGDMSSVQPVGSGIGTCITVENLFYNVPARLKFLKTASTELNHIVEHTQRFALSYPEISFRLQSNSHEIFRSSGSGSMIDACVEVFGRDTARHLLPVSHERVGVSVTGFLGAPNAMKSSRSGQHVFVNGRFVRNRAITRAFDEAYRSLQTIHGTRFPIGAIKVAVDPAQIDVNVSPTKTEVRFTREGDVYSAVFHAVQEALMAGGLVPNLGQSVNARSAATPNPDTALFRVPSVPAASLPNQRPPIHEQWDRTARFQSELAHGAPKEFTDPFRDESSYSSVTASVHANADALETPVVAKATETPEQTEENATLTPVLSEHSAIEKSTGADYRKHDLANVRILGQTRNMYILAQTEHALLLIDQHIAHERVLYEMLVNGAQSQAIATQRLIMPFTLELGKREAMVVQKRLDELRRAGFDIEPFGGESFIVRAVPASIATKSLKAQESAENTLREIIEEMVEKTVSRRLLLPADEVLITASCKMAVKAGDPLTMDEMHALLDALFRSENPYTCPHGRPILIELANNDIDKKFGR